MNITHSQSVRRGAALRRHFTVIRAALLALVAALALLVPTTSVQTAQAAAPARPTAVRAVPNGNGVYVTFEPAAGASAYEVWRDGMRLPDTGPLPMGPTGRLQYSDDTTTRGQHYVYSVRAVSASGYSGFVNADLTQWTDDGSRTWLSTKDGPAECARTGTTQARRVICTLKTASGWKINRAPLNVAWGNPEDRAWFTVDGLVNYCNLIGSRPDRTRVSCLDSVAGGWLFQQRSPVVEWGLGGNRTWLSSGNLPALCARTNAGSVPGLMCTTFTGQGWGSIQTTSPVNWGNPETRAWLTVNGRINYCATYGLSPSTQRVGCMQLNPGGWSKQSFSPVTDVGDPVQRTWLAGREGPVLCGRTEAGGVRSLVCTSKTSSGWRTDRAPGPVDWGYEQYRAWLSVGGTINYCGLVGDIPNNTRVSCRELGTTGWQAPSISPITNWGDPTNRTWMVGSGGPALCGRTGAYPDRRVACTVRKGQTWTFYESQGDIDWGYEAERAWTNAGGKISYSSEVGDYSSDQRLANVELGANGWGEQSISPTTDWGDNQP